MGDENPLRLNLGSGTTELDGFVNIDRSTGGEAYPLAKLGYEPGTIDEIRASHILEHFSHTQTVAVLADWFACLRPGGLLRVAVPDLKWIAEHYLDGKPLNVQGYLMGDQHDANAYHKCAFDEELLRETMINVGFERIGFWKSEMHDCAALPCSLNLQARKPSGPYDRCEKTIALLSCPRYGPLLHMRCATEALARARVPFSLMFGAYWHSVLSDMIEKVLLKDVEFIVTLDYDTVFVYEDLLELYRLIRAHDGADAICAMQCKRGGETILVGLTDALERKQTHVYEATLAMNLMPLSRAHFGLTIFRADTLRKHKRPWMVGEPDKDGRWGDGRVDADIDFWRRWKRAGHTLFQANRVTVGHLEEMISWPSRDLKPLYQDFINYVQNGIPAEVKR